MINLIPNLREKNPPEFIWMTEIQAAFCEFKFQSMFYPKNSFVVQHYVTLDHAMKRTNNIHLFKFHEAYAIHNIWMASARKM